MWAKLRKWFGLETRSQYVQNYLDFSNMRSSLYMSAVFIVLELWMIESLFQNLLTGSRQRSASWIAGHIVSYVLLLGIAVIMLIHSLRSLRRNQNRHGRTMLLCWLFAIISIAFGLYIAYNDYLKGEQIFVFVSMLIFALCLLVWSPLTALILSSLSFLGMYRIMVYIDGASYATRVNFFVMWICVVMSAFANYHQRVREAKKDEHLEQINGHLTQISLYDELTGMKNRNGMIEDLPGYYGREIIAIMADIDSFKYINDTYGHEMGDEVLRRMAELFNTVFEGLPVHCYRFGGDEFIIFADNADREAVLSGIKSWQEGLYQIGFLDTGIRVLCSCGYVYGTPKSRADIHDMIRFADQKLYEAKRHGRMQLLGESVSSIALRESSRPSGKRMMTESETDPMTGLPNMLYFREHADKLIKTRPDDARLAFLYYDIGNFKSYNEKYGFQSGDVLLQQFAEKLDTVFAGDLVARASDDHFIVLTQSDDYQDKVGELSTFLCGEQRDALLKLNVGIYVPEHAADCDSSLACDRARIACNSVKKHFDQSIRFYDKELENVLHRKQYIVNHLDSAIEQGYIKVYYQPIVWLSSGKVCGLEALARWDDPVYGLLSPGEFIEVLEEYRQIHKLDTCIIRLVCKDLQEARATGRATIPVSLNFSRLDFELCDMVTVLEQIAAEYDVPSSLLDVEITESALMDHPEFLSGAMNRLRGDGFRLWMDDFGSGYSSLNVLKDYEFDVLKIDMKFLSDFASNDRSKPILNNVVRLANEMSMCPLTEGVETDEQIAFLNSIGCERAQGYFYGKPMEKNKLIDFFERGELLISEEYAI